MLVQGRALVAGSCGGAELLYSEVGLSFWGGVDPETGVIVDKSHPLFGECVSGKVLALPSGRGSCTASQVVLELVLAGKGPAAVVLREADELVALGFVVAEEAFGATAAPVVAVDEAAYARLKGAATVAVVGTDGEVSGADAVIAAEALGGDRIKATASDEETLRGERGEARKWALRIVRRVAAMVGARELIDVTRAHIDAVTYIGPAGLRFAERLADAGGRVAVPTTTNAASVDLRRWRAQGISPTLGEPAEALARAYLRLGADPTFTCAPYLVDAPAPGEHLGWSESNAVTFANSVCGARTLKNADFLDACIALTGRAPLAGPHLHNGAAPSVRVDVDLDLDDADDRDDLDDTDALWAVAGYAVGGLASFRVPLVAGLDAVPSTPQDLKHFSASFATTSAAPAFAVLGHTPFHRDRALQNTLPTVRLDADALTAAWRHLGGWCSDDPECTHDDDDDHDRVDLVALGNPHASVAELARFEDLLLARDSAPRVPDAVKVVVTLARAVESDAGPLADRLAGYGVHFVTDTCWCMLQAPVVPPAARIVTNSPKYAHYAHGLVQPRATHLASLAGCADAALSGRAPRRPPPWLRLAARLFTSLPRRPR